ncbi:hypothetical protein TcWFU_004645 [Taenia crassiceps]|uniref:Uncharacterized protein n=1 Tax=Taenia crassiceps TaxID=6207 RepID=A0ABR4QQJ4_9CEST
MPPTGVVALFSQEPLLTTIFDELTDRPKSSFSQIEQLPRLHARTIQTGRTSMDQLLVAPRCASALESIMAEREFHDGQNGKRTSEDQHQGGRRDNYTNSNRVKQILRWQGSAAGRRVTQL